MERKEALRIAQTAIEKRMDYETLKYSDDLYGREDSVDDVWVYVEECESIGKIAFDRKYNL